MVLLTVETERVATVADAERIRHESIGEGVHRLTIRFGYLEDQDVPGVLATLSLDGLPSLAQPSYFLARERVVRSRRNGRLGVMLPIFAWMNRNAPSASAHFRPPPNRVVEMGAQVEL